MADRLTADQFTAFSRRNIRSKITRTLTLDNDSISLTDVTPYVRTWGRLQTAVYNKHPGHPGDLVIPVLTFECDNTGGQFNFGGSLFPGGVDDLASTVAHLTVAAEGTTWIDFTGAVLEPEVDESKIFRLVVEHPLAVMTQRIWAREDRIGGDTGINWSFNS